MGGLKPTAWAEFCPAAVWALVRLKIKVAGTGYKGYRVKTRFDISPHIFLPIIIL